MLSRALPLLADVASLWNPVLRELLFAPPMHAAGCGERDGEGSIFLCARLHTCMLVARKGDSPLQSVGAWAGPIRHWVDSSSPQWKHGPRRFSLIFILSSPPKTIFEIQSSALASCARPLSDLLLAVGVVLVAWRVNEYAQRHAVVTVFTFATSKGTC